MAKLQLDPKKIAAVKEVASGKIGQKLAEKAQQLKGGVQLSAYDRAAGKKLLTGLTTDKAAAAAAGSPMGGKAVAAQGRGGQTMGQKAVKAQGKGGPIVQAIKEKLTGKPTNAAPVKTEELKISTFKLPAVFEVAGNTYNKEDVLDAIKKAKSTYGANSNVYKSLLSSLGVREQSGQLLFSGREFKKPDLRKDAGKSYVDTAQTVLGNIPNTQRMSPSPYGRLASLEDSNKYSDRETVDLLKQFGVRPDRNLGKDQKATNR